MKTRTDADGTVWRRVSLRLLPTWLLIVAFVIGVAALIQVQDKELVLHIWAGKYVPIIHFVWQERDEE